VVHAGWFSSRFFSMMSFVLFVSGIFVTIGIAASGRPQLAIGVGSAIEGLSLLCGLSGWSLPPARIALSGSAILLVLAGGMAALEGYREPDADISVWLRIRRPALEDIDRKKADAAAGEYRRAQILMIKSPEILAAAIRMQGINELDAIRAQDDPVSWLADRIRVVWRENSEIIKVNMTGVRRGREAVDAAKIVNAIVSIYLDQVVETGRVVVLEEATP